MRGPHIVRALRWVILVLPGAAFAQIIIDPPFGYGPLGPPPQPAGNVGTPAKERLGKALFWDEQLSSSRTVACGTCHHASEGGIDPRGTLGSARATHPGPDGIAGTADDIVGSPGVMQGDAGGGYVWSPAFGIGEQVTPRRALSHINSGYPFELFWDGRARGPLRDPLTGDTLIAWGAALEIQALAPPLSTVEMGHLGRDWNDATARVAASVPLALATDIPGELETWLGKRTYPELFKDAFGTPEVTPVRIAMAIASYERTLFSNQAPLDSVLAGTGSLTAQEESGRQVFNNQAHCGGCHHVPLMGSDAMFNTGVRPASDDSGRAAVTHQDYEMGNFRVVSLRNVGLRHSFMHNGRFQTLEQVVDFYDRGGDFNSNNGGRFISIGPLGLTPEQKQDLLAFLRRPLTDPRVAAALPPFDEPRLYGQSDRMPRVLGGGVPGTGGIPQIVALEPPLAGNPAFTVGIYDGRTGAEAVLVIDDTEPPTGAGIPASGSLARISTTLMGAVADDGFGSVTLAIPNQGGFFTHQYFGRWYVVDPAAAGGVAASPSFRMTVFAPRGARQISIPFSGSPVVQVSPARPNPFVTSTVIDYELSIASPVTLAIYDISGRTVRTLVRHPMQSPGKYAVEWDGRDGDGRMLAGAVYFSRLDAAGTSKGFRVVHVK